MQIDCLTKFKLNPNIQGFKLMLVGIEKGVYNKFRSRLLATKIFNRDGLGLDSEAVLEFKHIYGIDPNDIVTFGIPNLEEDKLKILLPKKNGYFKCFGVVQSSIDARENRTFHVFDNPLGHDTAVESWNCVMNLIGNPPYIIIYKQRRDIYDQLDTSNGG